MEIIPGVQSKNVCPFCGNDVFIWDRLSQEIILCNSDVEPIKVLHRFERDEEHSTTISKPICNNCQNEIGAFVPQQFFYEVICDDEFEDSLPWFVSSNILSQAELMIQPEFVITRREPLSWNIASVVSPFGWLLVIEVVQRSGRFVLEGRVLTHEMATSEHVKTIAQDCVVECPPAVAGRYVFTLNGKKFAVHILEARYEGKPVMSVEELSKLPVSQEPADECISVVTHGNTEGNEEAYPYNANWTLLKYAPGSGGVLSGEYRTSDKEKLRQVITDALAEGYDTDDLVLMPPSRSVDIDEFLKEGSQ